MFGIHVTNKGWIPDFRRYPNKSPNQTFKVPRYLFPQHAYLSKRVPKCVSSLIINFAYHVGPRARINATIVTDYYRADRFYKNVLAGKHYCNPRWLRDHGVSIPRVDWMPLPYSHPLRDRAIKQIIDFDELPWAANQVHH